MYSGTLGLKHDPNLLLQLAHRYADDESVVVVIVSEGLGAEWLRERAGDLPGLVQLPFQPYDQLPEVLGSADVLLTILEPEAGVFSVPSKVLTYLCAGRPIVGAIPSANLAASVLERSGAGVSVDPSCVPGFVDAVDALVRDPERRDQHGRAARAYAERTFSIESIGDEFSLILEAATSARPGSFTVR